MFGSVVAAQRSRRRYHAAHPGVPRRPDPTRPALLGGLLLGGIAIAGHAAHAVDGVWSGPGAEWTTGTNWSSTPTVPDNTATFTNNGAPTSVTISNDASINTMQFSAAAPAYTFSTQQLRQPRHHGRHRRTVPRSRRPSPTLKTPPRRSSIAAARPTPASSTISSASRSSSTAAARAPLPSSTTASWFRPPISAERSISIIQVPPPMATIFNRNNGQTAFFQASTAGSATIVNSSNGPLDQVEMFLAGGTSITSERPAPATPPSSTTAAASRLSARRAARPMPPSSTTTAAPRISSRRAARAAQPSSPTRAVRSTSRA